MPVSKTRKLLDLRKQEQKLMLKMAWATNNTQDDIQFALLSIREKIKALSD